MQASRPRIRPRSRRAGEGAGAHSGHRAPVGATQVEEVVRRSRFATRIGPAASRAAAARFVRDAKKRLPGATRHCWAFNAGRPGSAAEAGMSDAGEPRGAAGRAMLAALLDSPVGEAAVVCARYYGGVKLGGAGLARAYADGVRRAVAACETKIERAAVSLTFGYEAYARVERVLEAMGAVVTARSHGFRVRCDASIPAGARLEIDAAVATATAGAGTVRDRAESTDDGRRGATARRAPRPAEERDPSTGRPPKPPLWSCLRDAGRFPATDRQGPASGACASTWSAGAPS